MSTSTLILAVLAAVAAFVVLRLLVRGIGASCERCGLKMARFDELPPTDQQEILDHYQRQESRRPDTAAMFACARCMVVQDDFSGVQRSMTDDSASLCKVCGAPFVRYVGYLVGDRQLLADANRERVADIECLRCQRQVKDCALCDTPIKVTGCRNCATLHTWQQDGRFAYRTALTDRPLLREARDRTGGLT